MPNGGAHRVTRPTNVPNSTGKWYDNRLDSNLIQRTSDALPTLKIWMVDPGIVIDTIIGDGHGEGGLGYTWPWETRNPNK